MTEYNPEDEEIDLDEIQLHTDPPELTKEEAQPPVQDDEADFENGEALGDDLGTAQEYRDKQEEQEDPDA